MTCAVCRHDVGFLSFPDQIDAKIEENAMRSDPVSYAQKQSVETYDARAQISLLKYVPSQELNLFAARTSRDEEDGDRRLHDRVKHREKMDSGAKMTV